MTRSKTIFSMLGAAALAISLTACGGDDSGGNDDSNSAGDYCDEALALGTDVSALTSTDPAASSDLADSYQRIADAAPSDIKADYQTLADAMKTLADLDMSDPESATKLADLGDLAGIATRIGEHIKSECGSN